MSMHSIPPTNEWRDKRWLWLLSPSIPVAFSAALAAFACSGQWLWLLFAPAFVHLVMPLLDLAFGEDFSNPPESAVAQLEEDFFYRALVWAYVPFQIAGTVFGAWLATTQALPWYAFAGLVLSVGSFNGIGIATAHELGHKKETLDRWLAKLALAPTMYGHFYVEHNRGHHKRVATPEDPASARMGESFWAFLPRTVLGSLRSAWELERERLDRMGKRVWSAKNNNLQAWAPHTIRHTTAMHLLQSGEQIEGIALWLGHESPTTTHQYTQANLAMKERALAKLRDPEIQPGRFRASDSLLNFLKKL